MRIILSGDDRIALWTVVKIDKVLRFIRSHEVSGAYIVTACVLSLEEEFIITVGNDTNTSVSEICTMVLACIVNPSGCLEQNSCNQRCLPLIVNFDLHIAGSAAAGMTGNPDSGCVYIRQHGKLLNCRVNSYGRSI